MSYGIKDMKNLLLTFRISSLFDLFTLNMNVCLIFHQSLYIRTQTLQPSDSSLADTLGAIARAYYINCNFERALELYKEALVIFQQAFSEDDLTSVMSYNNIGVVCRAQKKYSQALVYHLKALAIGNRHLPSDHFRFGTSYNNIGEVYQGLDQYDIALKYYELAKEVYKKSLPSRNVDNAILLLNIGLIHE
jgi:tetratricopeptide (TPR) repeat protein